jgi:hypothetical protein
VRPFGFIVTKAVPNGFSFTVQDQTPQGETTTKTYSTTIVDPSLTTSGPADYTWTITDYAGNKTIRTGQQAEFTVPVDQPFTIQIDRLRDGKTDTLNLRERGSDFARDNGQAFVLDMVTGSMSGQAYQDLNGNGTRDANDPPLDGVTVYLDTNDNGMLDPGEESTLTNPEGHYVFSSTPPGTYHVRQVVPSGYIARQAGHDVTLTDTSRNQNGLDFSDQPTSFTGSFNNDTFTVVDDPSESSRVQVSEGPAGATLTWDMDKASLEAAGGLTFNTSGGNDTINVNATGVTLRLTNAGGNKTINITGGEVTIDADLGFWDPVSSANLPDSATVNVSGGSVTFASSQFLAALDVTGGTVRLGSGHEVVFAHDLSISGAGRIDLGDGVLIVRNMPAGTWDAGTSAYTGLSGLVGAGRAGGSGIASGKIAGADDKLDSIGAARVGDVRNVADNATTIFDGQTVQGSDVVAAYTYGGDANLDGKINIDDYGLIDSHVGQSGSAFGWHNGDFNYDGKINIDDYGIIDSDIGAQAEPIPLAGGLVDHLDLGVKDAGRDRLMSSSPAPAVSMAPLLALGAVGVYRE